MDIVQYFLTGFQETLKLRKLREKLYGINLNKNIKTKKC